MVVPANPVPLRVEQTRCGPSRERPPRLRTWVLLGCGEECRKMERGRGSARSLSTISNTRLTQERRRLTHFMRCELLMRQVSWE
jgi:hypothetical protein